MSAGSVRLMTVAWHAEDSAPRFLDRIIPKRFRSGPTVPVVRLSGVIGISTPLKPGLTLANVARVLDRAFTFRRARAVALVINSPGGSAVQSHLIHGRIRALAAEHKLPVIAFVEDVGASGGYMIACAADEIVCDPSSILGSIGVVGATFGFEKALRKLGVERRIYTAGKNKAMLDPFLPENPEDVKKLKAIQQEIHDTFIALVKTRRGKKLRGPNRPCSRVNIGWGRKPWNSVSPTDLVTYARSCASVSVRRL